HYGKTEILKAANEGAVALVVAACGGHIDVVRLLLDIGCDPDEKERQRHHHSFTALHAACEGGHLDMVSMLVDAGADPNLRASGNTVLHFAVRTRNIPLIDILVAADKFNVDQADDVGRTALHCSIWFKFSHAVDILLDAGANVNKTDRDGWTPLRQAIYQGAIDIVSSIIKARPSVVSHVLNDQSTYLHTACRLGRPCCSKLLIENGASLEKKDRTGQTPLDHAVTGRRHAVETVKVLLSDDVYPADLVDQADIDGNTPIHTAVAVQNLDVLKLLVPKSSNMMLRNDRGDTAFALACCTSQPDIVKHLVDDCLTRCEGRDVKEHLYNLYFGNPEEQEND
ncbi:MAG: hypothetical protein SGILL_001682, partial [Bacillariaceae sp.]